MKDITIEEKLNEVETKLESKLLFVTVLLETLKEMDDSLGRAELNAYGQTVSDEFDEYHDIIKVIDDLKPHLTIDQLINIKRIECETLKTMKAVVEYANNLLKTKEV